MLRSRSSSSEPAEAANDAEIVLAFELARGGGHCGLVERPGIVQRAAVFEWRQDAPAKNPISVRLALRLPARVKIGAGFLGVDDADRRRQQRIERALNFRRRKRRLRLEMRHLSQRVNAGIGAARAVDHDFFLRDFARGVVERALNRRHTRLRLPAVKIGAVVRDGEFDIAHAIGAIIARRREVRDASRKKEGALAWDREPPKAAFRWSGLGVTGPGVIHPSFPLRGRWERPVPSCELGPFLPIHATGGSLERDPRRILCTSQAHSQRIRRTLPNTSILNELVSARLRQDTPTAGLGQVNSGSAAGEIPERYAAIDRALASAHHHNPPRDCAAGSLCRIM